jgi:SAM-dependent methyltransferase
MAIDAAQTVDLLKLRFVLDWMYNTHVYAEGPSGFHEEITKKMVKDYIDPLNLPKDAKILDLGCGPGYFLNEMKERGYTNMVGATLSPEDRKICEDNGHTTAPYDMSFLPVKDGYTDESVDFIFARHALEHSPFPIITLVEWNRVLKQGGKAYIELPMPDCQRRHEWNLNHYSILGASQWAALFVRAGFSIDAFNNFEFDLKLGRVDDKGELISEREKYYCIVVTKAKPLDLK